jgi:hypothetical protein
MSNRGTAIFNWIVDAMDLTDNVATTMDWIKEVSDGLNSWLMFIFAITAFIGTLVLSWVFDLSSSWTAMTHLRELAEPKIGMTSFASYSVYLLAVLTYLPTVFQMFGTQLARRGVRWFQILTAFLSLFDLYTDLPEVRAFMEPMYTNFVPATAEGLSWLVGNISYYVVFGLGWGAASFGFEHVCVLCGLSALCFFLKGMAGSPEAQRGHARGRA